MQGIKIFPLYMVDSFHKKVKDAAQKDNGKTIKDFIMDAIKEKVQEMENKN